MAFNFTPEKSLSHTLIFLCIVISIIGFVNPDFQRNYSFHDNALEMGFTSLTMQTVLFQFLHGGILHLLANSYFLYIAGPSVEARMSKNQFLFFFLSTTIFIVIALLLFAEKNTLTLGISGFCTALLAYLSIDLYTTRHPQTNEMITMLIVNIALGLASGISFVGHFFGAVW